MKIVAALVLMAVLPMAVAAQGEPCSRETLQVRGTPVTVTLCVTGAAQHAPGSELLVPVRAEYDAPGKSYQETVVLRFIASEDASRIIHGVDMSRLGSSGTLHLTLVYVDAGVRVESAMLTPGAITVK